MDQHHWACTDVITLQSHIFAAENCELVCLEDMGVIVDTDTQQEIDPSEWFDVDLVRDKGGTGEVRKCRPQGDDKVELGESWDDLLAAHEPGKCVMQLGNTNAKAGMDLYIFKRQRIGGERVYWGSHDLYIGLGMKSCKGVPSEWVYLSRQSRASSCRACFVC